MAARPFWRTSNTGGRFKSSSCFFFRNSLIVLYFRRRRKSIKLIIDQGIFGFSFVAFSCLIIVFYVLFNVVLFRVFSLLKYFFYNYLSLFLSILFFYFVKSMYILLYNKQEFMKSSEEIVFEKFFFRFISRI